MRLLFRRRRLSLWQIVIGGAIGWLSLSFVLSLLTDQLELSFHDDKSHQEKSEETTDLATEHRQFRHRFPAPTQVINAARNNDVFGRRFKLPWQDDDQVVGDENVVALPQDISGPGEMGAAVVLNNLTSEEKNRRETLWKRHYLDEYVSDMISLHRTLPDVRPPGCKEVKYPIEKLPQVSVIVCFHNEAFSVLLRTVHSILDRSPPQLLKEIILVDDYSDHEAMKRQLDEYISHMKKVRLVRCQKREGLIRGRLLGAKHATAPILVFLDSHSECTEGWLEPMVYHMYKNESNVVVPVIDVIDDRTLEYKGGPNHQVNVGGFDWNLIFNWHSPPAEDLAGRKNSWDPIKTPTMAGGLFGITRAFFEHVGTYDSGMDFWGGENLELSFKTWLCGGRLDTIPCSHVGHIFRHNSPHKWHGKNAVRKNCIRLALVWLDDYKQYYIQRIGDDNVKDYGDISQRLELKKRLKCKPFDYFVNEVWPHMFIPSDAVGQGAIRSRAEVMMCLDTMGEHKSRAVGVYQCHGQGGNQFWLYTRDGEIRSDDYCLDYSRNPNGEVRIEECHNSMGNQAWYYDPMSHLIHHNVSRTCLALTPGHKVVTQECDVTELRQQWSIAKYNATILSMPRRARRLSNY